MCVNFFCMHGAWLPSMAMSGRSCAGPCDAAATGSLRTMQQHTAELDQKQRGDGWHMLAKTCSEALLCAPSWLQAGSTLG